MCGKQMFTMLCRDSGAQRENFFILFFQFIDFRKREEQGEREK